MKRQLEFDPFEKTKNALIKTEKGSVVQPEFKIDRETIKNMVLE